MNIKFPGSMNFIRNHKNPGKNHSGQSYPTRLQFAAQKTTQNWDLETLRQQCQKAKYPYHGLWESDTTNLKRVLALMLQESSQDLPSITTGLGMLLNACNTLKQQLGKNAEPFRRQALDFLCTSIESYSKFRKGSSKNPSQDFESYIKELLIQHQRVSPLVPDARDAIILTRCLIEDSKSTQQFTGLVDQLEQFMKDTTIPEELKDLSLPIFILYRRPESIPVALQLLKKSFRESGDFQVFAKFLVNDNHGLRYVPPEVLTNNFDTMGTRLKKFNKSPESLEDFRKVLDAFWRKQPNQYQMGYLDFADTVTEILQSFPSSLNEESKWMLLRAIVDKSPDDATLKKTPGQLKTFYCELEGNNDSKESLARILASTGSLERAQHAMSIFRSLDAMSQNNTETKSKVVNDLTTLMQDTPPHYSSRDNVLKHFTIPVLAEITKTVQSFSREIRPDSLEAAIFPLALVDTMDMVKKGTLPIEAFEACLKQMVSTGALVPKESVGIWRRMTGACLIPPANKADPSLIFKKLELLHGAISAYRAEVQPPDDLTPIMDLLYKLSVERKLRLWPPMIKAFIREMASVPVTDRKRFEEAGHWLKVICKEVTTEALHCIYTGSYQKLLNAAIGLRQTLTAANPTMDWTHAIENLIPLTQDMAAFEQKADALKTLTENDTTDPQGRAQALDVFLHYSFPSEKRKKAEIIRPMLQDYLARNGDTRALVILLSDPKIQEMPTTDYQSLMANILPKLENPAALSTLLQAEKSLNYPETAYPVILASLIPKLASFSDSTSEKELKELADLAAKLQPLAKESPQAFAVAMKLITELPEKRMELVDLAAKLQPLAKESPQAVAVAMKLISELPEKRMELADLAAKLQPLAKESPQAFAVAMKLITELPEKRLETAENLGLVPGLIKELMTINPLVTDWEKYFSVNLKLFTLLHFPNKMLNYYMQHKNEIDPLTMFQLFSFIEYKGSISLGKSVLPELMALLGPYQEQGKAAYQEGSPYISYLEQATAAITRLYRFIENSNGIQGISLVSGISYKNWAKIGTLGLSFTKWQYDSMRLWKGAGPAERAPLLEQSGIFKPVPPRENDKRYFGGFLHYDPQTGISFEMRRAYLVISKPGLGSLVIRNSSPVFGRDLMEEPAYFHPDKLYTQGQDLFNPDSDLKDAEFKGIFDKRLYLPDARQQNRIELKNQERIEGLLNTIDSVMAGYTGWKCQFQDGKAPPGFREMLRSSLQSASNDGATTPFRNKKNIRLAWANPFQLPYSLKSLDVTSPEIQAEMAFYLKVLNRQIQVSRPEEYEQKIPHLKAFLEEGLQKGYELILTE